jgi:predicted AlkP superfamily phosphohydrolase/phosphomutase
MLRNLLPGLKNRANSILRGMRIDWEHTKAFSWENAPTIYVNVKGKFPCGHVEPGQEYEEVMGQLTEDLLNLRSPEDGEPMVERVVRKEDLYHGPFVAKAPDLFIAWKDDQYTVRPGYASQGGRFVEVMTGDRLKEAETISRASGVHKPDGVFVFCGPHVEQGMQTKDLNLDDVTATILYYLGSAVPEDFDGRVATDVFSEPFLRDNAVRCSKVSSERKSFDLGYTEEEARVIESRLQGLGYID